MAEPAEVRTALDLLVSSTDDEVAAVGRRLRSLFGSSRLAPPPDVLDARERVCADVLRLMPTPFAEQFRQWMRERDGFLAACDAEDGTAASARWRETFSLQYDCRMQVLRFAPFILMCAANRMREAVQRHAPREFAAAVRLNERMYAVDARSRDDSLPRELLAALLATFRALDRAGALDERFIFGPLLGADGFDGLFPPRFDEQLLALQQLRNDLQHRSIHARPVVYLRALELLVGAIFLDVVGRVLTVCRAYAVGYALSVGVTEGGTSADVLVFDGEGDPRVAPLAIDPTPRSEFERFDVQRLYLIAREAFAREGSPVQPKEYLDLTPLLISETTPRHPNHTDDHDVFALDAYRGEETEPSRRLSFRQLASAWMFPSGAGAETAKLLRLIKAVEEFRARTRAFAGDLTEEEAERWDETSLRAKLWRLSTEHLTAVLDAKRYDDRGNRVVADADGAPATYDEALFVPPPEAQRIDAFFDAPLGGMLMIGQSGFGKSTLLCDAYLRRLRAGDFALFVSARQLRTASFEASLSYYALRWMNHRRVSLRSLEPFLAESGKQLVVFVDAVNEYTGEGGPLELLESIVRFVGGDAVHGVRVVATCRTETWTRFRERSMDRRPLADARFYADDAVVLGEFADEELRARLYDRYRAVYHLAPSTYAKLGAGVRALLRMPLMMAIIASTYGSAAPGAPPARIPADVDYFRIFTTLTQRKTNDAEQFVAPDDPRARYFARELRRALQRIGELLYERLSTTRRIDGVRDALPIDVLAKDRGRDGEGGFAELMHDEHERITVYEALLQTHLIEEVVVAERDSLGGEEEGRAVRFFHDQYAQYRLAMVYGNDDVLGTLDTARATDAHALGALVGDVAAIAERSVNAPVLAGALDHWLHAQLVRRDAPLDFGDAVPLLAALAAHPSSIVRDAARRIVMSYALREVLPPRHVFELTLRRGTPRLARELANAFVDHWPGVPADVTRAFLSACGAADATAALQRLGDVFAVHFANDASGERVIAYVREVVPAFSPAMLRDLARAKAGITFLVNFCQSAVVSQFSEPHKMLRLRDLVRAKAAPLITLLTARKGFGALLEPLRLFANRAIDQTGIKCWNEAIGSQANNNAFFVEEDGLCQREILFAFFPYCVAMHNGRHDRLSLEPSSEFRTLALRMMRYRVTSVIGYVAMATLSVVLTDDWETARGIVEELVAEGGEPAQFFGTLLLVNVSYTNPANCRPALRLLATTFVDRMRAGTARYDWVLHDTLGVVDMEVAGLWDEAAAIVAAILDHVDATQPGEAIDEFGHELAKAAFFPDVRIGKEVVALLLRRRMLANPRWRLAARRACGALGVRSPAALQQLFDEFGVAEEERRLVRAAVDDEVELQSSRFAVQTSWNRFISIALARIVTVRYLLLADLIGGLIQSNTVPEYAREFRRFVIDAVRAYLTEEGAKRDYSRMSLDEVYAAAGAVRKPGAGEVWAPAANA